MVASKDRILSQALLLDETDRRELAERLLGSLGDADAAIAAEWDVEIERRVRKLRAGKSKSLPWGKVRKRVSKKINGTSDSDQPGSKRGN